MKPQIMTKRNSQFQNSLAGVCSVLLLLGAGQPGVAQQSAPAMPAVTASAASHNPGKEGIRVHGHWTIDVKNHDGSLAEHREFENALVTGQAGDSLLVGLISGYLVPGGYLVEISGQSGTGVNNPAQVSYIVQSVTAHPGDVLCGSAQCVPSLTYTVNLPLTGAASFVLAGSFSPDYSGTLNSVSTQYAVCENNEKNEGLQGSTGLTFTPPSGISTASPNTCFTSAPANIGFFGFFTQTVLPTPLSVTSGQLVQVAVTISFS